MRKARRTAVHAVGKLLRRRQAPVPLPVLFDMWRHGFGGWSYIFYEFERERRFDAFLPDLAMRAMTDLNDPTAKAIMRNKLVFERVVGRFARVPEVLALVWRGRLVPAASSGGPGDTEELLELAASSPLILKPIGGNRGYGVLRLDHDGEGPVLNDARVSREELQRRLDGLEDYLVNRRVPNGAYADAIFPHATNTVRVMTLRDPDSGEPFIPAAVHRFGRASSAPTDNVSQGGFTARVDVDTGELGDGHALNERSRIDHLDRHPETGAPVRGVRLPGWDGVRETVLALMRKLPMMVNVGWDVVVGDDGVTVLEGNTAPSLHVQAHHPYLLDPRVRRFVEHHRVLRR